ncbi:S8 family serine peptidase [Halobaculum marinum]|uniref:S8 family serine peptidase n=1 Tax=Halobaculum marinum TaxID=3031996 RepID=A0ABD5WWQ3_9EURY|nr:S8 family serine peptidase [Halobaculum sp. DT55]
MSNDAHEVLVVAFVGVLVVTAGLTAATLTDPASRSPPTDGRPVAEPDLRPVADAEPWSRLGDEATPPGGSAVTRIHDAGETGDGVRVGVIDASGYDPSDPVVADRVLAVRGFGDSDPLAGPDHHGTATTTTVAEVAPGARFLLTRIDSQRGFVRAVEWLIERDVDVIVAPVSFYGAAGDGRSRAASAAAAAVDAGVTVVAPVGNVAKRHWTTVDRSTDATVVVDGARETPLLGDRERAVVWVEWERGTGPYTATLYRLNDDGRTPVARSVPYRRDGTPNARLSTSLRGGRYAVVVSGPRDDTGGRVSLTSPTHRFGVVSADGSVLSPAAGAGVVGVGAVGELGEPAAYSGRGPTTDGRLGVDVAATGTVVGSGDAERFEGTSVAAARVAGVAALIHGADPTVTPRTVEQRLERTAMDRGRDGVDLATGHGVVDPWPAVFGADERSPAAGPTRTPT